MTLGMLFLVILDSRMENINGTSLWIKLLIVMDSYMEFVQIQENNFYKVQPILNQIMEFDYFLIFLKGN